MDKGNETEKSRTDRERLELAVFGIRHLVFCSERVDGARMVSEDRLLKLVDDVLEGLDDGTEPSEDPPMYFIASPKHSPVWGELTNWWGPNNSGYTPDLSRAGRYTQEQIDAKPHYYDDGVEAIAVPVRLVLRESIRIVTWRDPKRWQRLIDEDAKEQSELRSIAEPEGGES